jgi:hypothetical protein
MVSPELWRYGSVSLPQATPWLDRAVPALSFEASIGIPARERTKHGRTLYRKQPLPSQASRGYLGCFRFLPAPGVVFSSLMASSRASVFAVAQFREHHT